MAPRSSPRLAAGRQPAGRGQPPREAELSGEALAELAVHQIVVRDLELAREIEDADRIAVLAVSEPAGARGGADRPRRWLVVGREQPEPSVGGAGQLELIVVELRAVAGGGEQLLDPAGLVGHRLIGALQVAFAEQELDVEAARPQGE